MKFRKIILVVCMFLFTSQVYAKEKVELLKCVDGDTFKVIIENDEFVVRMIAVDTPESVHPKKPVEYYGKEASKYTCSKLTNAKKIELEYDPNSDKLDKYGRLLAWVYVDNELLQLSLVEEGYAKVAYLYGDYLYIDKLNKAQEIASSRNLGIWNIEEKNKFIKSDGVEYSMADYVVICLLILIVIFIGDKTIKSKAKKKLKTYLK